jgi:ATP-dependent helicase HrpB
MDFLPIDAHIPQIISALKSANALVLSAPPGAGKTTRIPRALYEAGFAEHGQILILEPRRLAAKLAAAWVAQEMGEKPGETVGYSIRYENAAGPHTRVHFLTEAILSRRIVHDPYLKGVSTVIVDEFHERHLTTDLALAFLKRLQDGNRELKIIVMSATLDPAPIVAFLANAKPISLSGSPFEVEIEYEDRANDRPLHEKVASAVSNLIRSGLDGDILAFLPGSSEIRRAAESLQPVAQRSGLLILPLHGDLSLTDQKRAITPAEGRKVILATNVAETSITIPGIGAVIDSGLARVAGHSPWSGFPTLSTARISKSSARQRAGRAGRTQAGRVLRLYTRPDFEARPEYETPEIKRADLTETTLLLHGAGIRDLRSFPWFEPPPGAAIEAAETLLLQLRAVDAAGNITDTGKRMLELPVHPRLARLIVEAKNQDLAEEGILLAALLSERDIRLRTRAKFGSKAPEIHPGASGRSDLLEILECFREAENADFSLRRLPDFGLDPAAVESVRKGQRQLRRLIFSQKQESGAYSRNREEDGLLIAILSAFPDRVAKRRKAGARELLLAGGGSAMLAPFSVVHEPMFVVAVDAEERRDRLHPEQTGILVRLASAIDIDWLAALFPDSIAQKSELFWNERGQRVDERRGSTYNQLTLEERSFPSLSSEEASQILFSEVLSHPPTGTRDLASLPSLQARVSLARLYFPDALFPEIGDEMILETIQALCRGKTRMEEIAQVSLPESIMNRLTDRQRSVLARETPEKIRLKAGRAVKVHYEAARLPWIESRLQDFFGMTATPRICMGQVPITIHLLAPNGRAVQVTTDLAGFWQRHYPSIRKELQRRYPKHAWPDISRV